MDLDAVCRRRLPLVQRDQFFTGRNIWRFSDHPILESETASRVQENLLKIKPLGNNLGSYKFSNEALIYPRRLSAGV